MLHCVPIILLLFPVPSECLIVTIYLTTSRLAAANQSFHCCVDSGSDLSSSVKSFSLESLFRSVARAVSDPPSPPAWPAVPALSRALLLAAEGLKCNWASGGRVGGGEKRFTNSHVLKAHAHMHNHCIT